MKLRILFLALFAFPFVMSAELITLNSKNGGSSQVMIDQYDSRNEVVTVRVDGTGSRTSIKLSDLDAPSVNRVKDWGLANAVDRLVRFDVKRLLGAAKGTSFYEIEMSNSSDSPIDGLRAEYEVPMIKRRQIQKVTTYTVKSRTGSNNNNKKRKRQRVTYKVVETRDVHHGEVKLGTIPVREKYVVRSGPISTQSVQMFGGSAKEVKARRTNEHSVKGILIHIYSGNKLLRTVSSSPGVEQLVVQYQ